MFDYFLPEQILEATDKSKEECGASGGRNNTEVFHLVVLIIQTNAYANDSQQNGNQFCLQRT